MIRWMCNVKVEDEVSSDSLLLKLGIQDIEEVLRIGPRIGLPPLSKSVIYRVLCLVPCIGPTHALEQLSAGAARYVSFPFTPVVS